MSNIIVEKENRFLIQFDFNRRISQAVVKIPEIEYNHKYRRWEAPIRQYDHVLKFGAKYGFILPEKESRRNVFSDAPVELPELTQEIDLKMQLFPYQKNGVAYALEKGSCIIGDSPGLGKTAQAIAAICARDLFPCLVICPASLKYNWLLEWKLWTGKHDPAILTDTIKNTWSVFYQMGMHDVFITNYESLKKYFVVKIDTPKGERFKLAHIKFHPNINLFKSVIIDESHKAKDPSTMQSKLCYGITRDKEMVLLLTGTPIVNRPVDLLSQILMAGKMHHFGTINEFREMCADEERWPEINTILRKNCYFRREKKSVLKDLPDKYRQKVYCEIDNREEYSAALNDLARYLAEYRQATDAQIQKSMRGEIMVRIGALKNIAARGKLNDAIEYIDNIIQQGEKIVVFIYLKEIAARLKEHYPEALFFTGEQNEDERNRAIDDFQRCEECGTRFERHMEAGHEFVPSPHNIIFVNYKAGGVGITLTASSTELFVELPWHPADVEQAESRCIIEGEPVLTPDGWKPVENIQTGDTVINMNGDVAVVSDTWSKGNTKLVTEIQIEGYGLIRTTGDHKILTLSGWKEASHIQPGERIAMPYPRTGDIGELKSVPFDEDCRINEYFKNCFGKLQRNGRLIKAPEAVNLTDNALFFFGYFAGDGFAASRENGRFISVAGHSKNKRESLNRCCKWFDEINLYHSEYKGADNGVEIRAYSGEWTLFFRKHFGKYAHGKQLPEFLMYLNERQSRILLEGLMSSDGYYHKGRYEYTTASDKLCSQVARLILRCGYRPTLNVNYTGQHVISYSATQTNRESLVRSVCTHYPKQENGPRPKVYDITTDKTESFVVGLSVVHNCHRISQKNAVQVSFFLGRNTIDETIMQIIEDKREMSEACTGAVDDAEERIINALDEILKK